MAIHFKVGVLCVLVILTAVLDSCQGCILKAVIKSGRSYGVKIIVSLKECTEQDVYRAIWMDSEGRAIAEVRNPLESQNGANRVTEAIVKDCTATVIIGTGMKWMRLTIDASNESGRQTFPPIPHLQSKNELKISGGGFVNFLVEHPELSDEIMNAESPFDSLPFIWDIRDFDRRGNLQKSSFMDSGYFYWNKRKTQAVADDPSVQQSEFRFFPPSATSSGVVTLTYTTETPDKIVQLTQVGENVEFYPSDKTGAFQDRPLVVSQNYGRSYDYVTCYNPNYRCEVNCFGASKRRGLRVTVSKVKDTEDNLVTVTPMAGEFSAQVSFPVLPDGQNKMSQYRCTATDNSGNSVSRDISVNFGIFLKVQTSESSVIRTGGIYQVLCVVEGFPYAHDVTLEFSFSDGSTVPVTGSFSHPHWSTTEVRGILPVDEGSDTLDGVICTALNAYGGTVSSKTIEFTP